MHPALAAVVALIVGLYLGYRIRGWMDKPTGGV